MRRTQRLLVTVAVVAFLVTAAVIVGAGMWLGGDPEPPCLGGASSVGPVTYDPETGEFKGDLTPHVTGCLP